MKNIYKTVLEKIQIKNTHSPEAYLQEVHKKVLKGESSPGWVCLGLCVKKAVLLSYLKIKVHIPLLTDRGTPSIVGLISVF